MAEQTESSAAKSDDLRSICRTQLSLLSRKRRLSLLRYPRPLYRLRGMYTPRINEPFQLLHIPIVLLITETNLPMTLCSQSQGPVVGVRSIQPMTFGDNLPWHGLFWRCDQRKQRLAVTSALFDDLRQSKPCIGPHAPGRAKDSRVSSVCPVLCF